MSPTINPADPFVVYLAVREVPRRLLSTRVDPTWQAELRFLDARSDRYVTCGTRKRKTRDEAIAAVRSLASRRRWTIDDQRLSWNTRDAANDRAIAELAAEAVAEAVAEKPEGDHVKKKPAKKPAKAVAKKTARTLKPKDHPARAEAAPKVDPARAEAAAEVLQAVWLNEKTFELENEVVLEDGRPVVTADAEGHLWVMVKLHVPTLDVDDWLDGTHIDHPNNKLDEDNDA